jgi:hypothetical protein
LVRFQYFNNYIAVSAYLFFTTLAGTYSTFLLGLIENYYDLRLKGNEYKYGYVIFAFVTFSYLGSVPFFYLAG